MNSNELRAERAKLIPRIKEFQIRANDDDHVWTDEDETNWSALNKDYDGFSVKIQRAERVERAEEMQSEQREVVNRTEREDRSGTSNHAEREAPITEEMRSLAIQGWMLYQSGRTVRDEHIEACKRLRFNLRSSELVLDLWNTGEVRHNRARMQFRGSENEKTATQGLELVPEGFVNNWEMSLLAFGGMRQAATILRTATGNSMPWPTTNDTGNAGALVAEVTDPGDEHVPTAAITFEAYKYSSKFVRVSAELLEDSAFNLVNELGRITGERVARGTEAHFATGTGTAQPQGVTVGAGAGVTAASATVFTAAELIDLFHTVDPAYRTPGRAKWMMNDTSAKELRTLLVNAEANNFLWQPGFTSAMPDTILGFPLIINQQMPNSATTLVPIVFGDLKKYVIRDAGQLRFRRLVERFADTDEEAFITFSRHDGRVLDAGTDPIKKMTMA